MKISVLLRLILQNILQNKFKTIMTSIGIVIGTATIVLVIAIGRGGQLDVLDQFKTLNAGAIDVTYEMAASAAGGNSFANLFSQTMGSGGRGGMSGGSGGGFSMFGGSRGGFSMPGGDGGSFQMPGGGDFQMPEGGDFQMPEGGDFQMPDGSDFTMPEGGDFQMPEGSDFTMPEGGDFQMPEGSDFTMPDRGDFQMPEGSDFTMPDGGDFQMPEGSDFTMPDRGDFQMPEGSDFTMPEGGDFQMPEGSDFTMSEEGETEGTGEAGEPESDSEISDSELPSRADEDKEQETEAEDDTEKNLEQIILSDSDVEDIELFVPGISAVTLSYSTKSTVDGGELEAETSYTIAGVKSNYAAISNLEIAVGSFIEDDDETNKQKICVLGATAAKEIFGSAMDAYDSVLYIDGRSYVVNGVLEAIGTVSSGISPDEAIFVPYATGVKYITGENINPTLTVLAEDATSVDQTIEKITAVLAETYPNAEFTFTDAGSKMEAAEQSNSILTILLTAMAAIVFVVGGIGIMNVLFVAVKERTEEIGILKAIGCTRKDILLDFLLEAAIISLIGGILGIGLSFAVEPVATYLGVRVEMTANAWIIALAFAIGTGTIFGFYPAWKASRLLPVQALNQE